MSEIGLHGSLAGFRTRLSVGQGMQGNTTKGRQDKSTDRGRAHMADRIWIFGHCERESAGASDRNNNDIKSLGAITGPKARERRHDGA